VKDQAHLAGIIERAHELGPELVSVESVQAQADEPRKGTA
jgi:hypothetical protein